MIPPPPHESDQDNGDFRPGSWGEYRRLVLDRLGSIQKDQEFIKENYISKQYFDAMLRPIFRIVYTAVAIILTSFLAGIVALIYSGAPQ